MANRVRTRSASNYTFAQVPKAEIPRSSFNRSHTHKTVFDAGDLVPIYVDEVLPGDTFNLKMSVFARLATPIFPIMDGLYLESFFFFVPNRLVWDNWQKFMGEQKNPNDSTDYLVPTLVPQCTVTEGTPGDYMGLPIGVPITGINALPFRAYNLIWNEWFRDENMQNSVIVATDDGPDPVIDGRYTNLHKRGKRHDYFTGCLPWPQKGPGVEIALSGNGTVIPTGDSVPRFTYTGVATTPLQANPDTNVRSTASSGGPVEMKWLDPSLEVDMSTVMATTINSLRQAFQIQKLMERDARGGTRYVEILRSHFGVISPDARLQRPEYLGGGHSPVIINPVTQTSGSPTTSSGYTATPQGNMSAYGIVSGEGHGFVKSFVEHGYIIGLVCVRGDISYQQGMHKMWSRSTKYDFYWPALAHLGEQAVLNKEIYLQNSAVDDQVFGYQERWAEYRYGVSKVTNYMRSTSSAPLDAWHLAQEFTTLPVLGEDFIKENPPLDRCIAVQNEPHFIFDSYFNINCVRPMPVYSVPGMIDHF